MTAAAVAMSDAWMETCLIAISKVGGSDIEFAGFTETVTPTFGKKGIEGIPLVNGGRVRKWTPEEDSTLKFEGYPIQAGTDAGTTAKGYYDLMHSVDETVPIRILNDHNRDLYRILVMWSNHSSQANAQSITVATYSALRIGMIGHFESATFDFADGIQKWTCEFKAVAFDKAASANILVESCAGVGDTDILPAVAAFTTANKFS